MTSFRSNVLNEAQILERLCGVYICGDATTNTTHVKNGTFRILILAHGCQYSETIFKHACQFRIPESNCHAAFLSACLERKRTAVYHPSSTWAAHRAGKTATVSPVSQSCGSSPCKPVSERKKSRRRSGKLTRGSRVPASPRSGAGQLRRNFFIRASEPMPR